jgi:hypothetical protein
MFTFFPFLLLSLYTCISTTAQLLPLLNGKTGLPVLQDPTFNLLPGELVLQSQLRSWGINISLDLDVDLKLDLLGLDILKRGKDERRSRSERAMLGLGMGGKAGSSKLNLGLGLGLGSETKVDLGAGVGVLNLEATVEGSEWGKADGTARGERGDTAVSRTAHTCTRSGMY